MLVGEVLQFYSLYKKKNLLKLTHHVDIAEQHRHNPKNRFVEAAHVDY